MIGQVWDEVDGGGKLKFAIFNNQFFYEGKTEFWNLEEMHSKDETFKVYCPSAKEGKQLAFRRFHLLELLLGVLRGS